MINFIVTYLFIGTIFMICIELLLDQLGKRHVPNIEQLKEGIGGWSRLIGIVLWPIGIVIFVSGYLTTIFKNNKDE